MGNFGFLKRELLADVESAHDVYRAIRAALRLTEEGELFLPERQRRLIRRLEKALRQFHETGSKSTSDSLPLAQANLILDELRLTCALEILSL